MREIRKRALTASTFAPSAIGIVINLLKIGVGSKGLLPQWSYTDDLATLIFEVAAG